MAKIESGEIDEDAAAHDPVPAITKVGRADACALDGSCVLVFIARCMVNSSRRPREMVGQAYMLDSTVGAVCIVIG